MQLFSLDGFFAGLKEVNGDLSTQEKREEFFASVQENTDPEFSGQVEESLAQACADGLFNQEE